MFCNVGNEALRVLVYIQKPRQMRGTEAQASQVIARKRQQEYPQQLAENHKGRDSHSGRIGTKTVRKELPAEAWGSFDPRHFGLL